MVAKISFPKRLLSALNYNEKKVQKGVAVCIGAGSFMDEAKNLSFHQKQLRFEMQNGLNQRAATNTIHISLNFDPKESFTDTRFCDIAENYLQRIGFSDQPYLIYRHFDAGHPHVHIVSSTIKADGSRINTHNIGKLQSEKARKEIEKQFGLTVAQKGKQKTWSIPPINAKAIIYGKEETKKAIATVVNAVIGSYAFTSLPELNSILKQFNVIADNGMEGSRIQKNQGLVYRVLDERGNNIGVPIKASLLSSSPTLKNLQERFTGNKVKKEALKEGIKNEVRELLLTNPGTLENFTNILLSKNIYTKLHKNADGYVYGITFVDNLHKCVFNGSQLGKDFSIAGIQAYLNSNDEKNHKPYQEQENRKNTSVGNVRESIDTKDKLLEVVVDQTAQHLFASKDGFDGISYPLIRKKKRKKKQSPSS
jgi:hypothetical protein